MKEAVNRRTFEVIDTMRFPLIFLVIVAHMVSFEHKPVTLSFDGWEIYTLVSEMLSHNLAKISVRFYFFVSGYFFFRNLLVLNKVTYSLELKKKAKTILLPYLFWNAAIIIATLSINALANLLNISGLHSQDVTLQEVLKPQSLYNIFWGTPANFPLWYMRDLICMMLLTPVLYGYLKATKIYGVLILLVLYLSVVESGVPGLSTTAFFFFSAGGYFVLFKKDILGFCHTYRKISMLFALLMLVVATSLNGTPWHEYAVRIFILFGIISAINLFSYLLRYERLKQLLLSLSASTFFIYVVHEIYIINWLKGALARSPFAENPWGMLLGYVVVPCICILICLGLYCSFRRISPNLLSFATGGRIYNRSAKERKG